MREVMRRVPAVASVLAVAFVLCEISLRALAPVLSHPLRAVIREEAHQAAQSSLRVAQGSRIILRDSDFAGGADVVVVGDSLVFGTLVGEAGLFTTRLESETGLRVLNLGISSRGPCQYGHMFRLALDHLKEAPRLLIYTAFANDFIEGSCSGQAYQDYYIWEKDYRKNALLRLGRLREWLFQHSVTYYLAKRLWTVRRLVVEEYKPVSYEDERYDFVFADTSWWKAQLDMEAEGVSAYVRDFLEKLSATRVLADRAGTQVLVLLMPFKEQVYIPVLLGEGRVTADAYHPSFDATYDHVAASVRETGVEVLDLRESFRRKARRGKKLYWTLDGHLTPEGHALVARELQGFLARDPAASGWGKTP